MKYETKVTHRTTASGGQETVTEQVPVYSKLEQAIMNRAAKRAAKQAGAGEGESKEQKHNLVWTIVKHPIVMLMVVGLIAIFIVYLVSSSNAQLDSLIEQYVSLTARVDDSKSSFDKRLFYVTVNSDGTKTVTFGYKSDVAQEEAEQAVAEAAAGGSGTVTNIDTSGWYSDAGVVTATTSGTELDGIKIYDGVPWNTTSSTYAVIYDNARNDIYDLIANATNLSKPTLGYKIINSTVPGGGQWKNVSGVTVNTVDGTSTVTIDGVTCVGFCPAPIVVDRTYYTSGTWKSSSTPSSSMYGYGTKKYCIILVPKGLSKTDSSNWRYLPASAQDAKGHTYPGGVVQTNCKILNSSTVQVATNNSGSTSTNVSLQTGESIDSNDFINRVNDALSGNSMTSWNNNVLETYNWSASLKNNIINNYDIVGFMVWG